MATQWQGPHFIAIVAASALAFAGGYMVAGRSRPAPSVLPATNTSNGAEPTGIPGFDTNGQAPQPRGRVDENELIARNAEPEGGEVPQSGTNSSRAQPEERRTRPPREQQDEDKPPPSESEDEQRLDPEDR